MSRNKQLNVYLTRIRDGLAGSQPAIVAAYSTCVELANYPELWQSKAKQFEQLLREEGINVGHYKAFKDALKYVSTNVIVRMGLSVTYEINRVAKLNASPRALNALITAVVAELDGRIPSGAAARRAVHAIAHRLKLRVPQRQPNTPTWAVKALCDIVATSKSDRREYHIALNALKAHGLMNGVGAKAA